jgi:hypothetical protein
VYHVDSAPSKKEHKRGEKRMAEHIAIAAAVYVLMTLVMTGLGTAYNWAIQQLPAFEIVPTSFQVVIGVSATEILRGLRWLAVVLLLARYLPWSAWTVALAFLALWSGDVLLGYGATGLPMIAGNLRATSVQERQRDAVLTEHAREQVGAVND